ncbi:hypothetical protein [Porticoccus sp.]|uniref:hypothetical protein n=1 Tax=Porticoccus sp. TaxID=2024853 RepID=UPI003F69AB84
MKSWKRWIIFWVVLTVVPQQLVADESHRHDSPEIRQHSEPEMITEADLALWGIVDGCLNSKLVHYFYVLNSHAAVIELVGGKKVLMRFHGDCQGVEQYGFVHTAQNNKFCAGSHSIRVLQTGDRCKVKSLEPYP